jgi:hypothetical protein
MYAALMYVHCLHVGTCRDATWCQGHTRMRSFMHTQTHKHIYAHKCLHHLRARVYILSMGAFRKVFMFPNHTRMHTDSNFILPQHAMYVGACRHDDTDADKTKCGAFLSHSKSRADAEGVHARTKHGPWLSRCTPQLRHGWQAHVPPAS